MLNVFKKLVGDPNDRALKELWPVVEEVNAFGDDMAALDEAGLRAVTDRLRARLDEGEDLDDVLPEALAVVREGIARTTGERAYDVQVLGAIALHQGSIAEMKTGEGKTLVAALALYLNALEGQGAHLVTVNDYLARRDAQWYGQALHMLGMRIGVLQNNAAFVYDPELVSQAADMPHLRPAPRREAYARRHHLRHQQRVRLRLPARQHGAVRGRQGAALAALRDRRRGGQRPHRRGAHAADHLGAAGRRPVGLPALRPPHADADPRRALHRRGAHALGAPHRGGIEQLERGLGIQNIYALENFRLTRYMEAALKAEIIYQRDRDYVVRDGEVIIVDDFTGRLMEGRRWSDGLHQAVEAKEGVPIQQETITYATITLQNFFRMYEKLAGMTGTASTEAEELAEIYKLEVLVIPTNQPMVREDFPDLVYIDTAAKFKAVVADVVEKHETGRPVLVGTVTIETSEELSDLLRRRGIDHEVLNAKQHAREATIVAQAGQRGAVTIATNMAGRGTDIKLGEGVAGLGGLHIIGTERHESRRIDNQLRGRAGRQGDPGSSRFFVSFEDEIMKRFAPDWLPGLMSRLGMNDDQPLESKMVTRAIEQAQQKVEAYNFDIRKHVVEYDDVMNTHREVIYTERDKVLAGESMRDTAVTMVIEEVETLGEALLGAAPRDPEGFLAQLETIVPIEGRFTADDFESDPVDEILDRVVEVVEEKYAEIEEQNGEEGQRLIERFLLLRTIDTLWVQHLTAVDEMRQGIGLRAYGSNDPLVAYKREARDMWDQLLENIRSTVARQLFHARLVQAQQAAPRPAPRNVRESGPADEPAAASRGGTATATRTETVRKVGRNELCPCGSGRKYKRCHGQGV